MNPISHQRRFFWQGVFRLPLEGGGPSEGWWKECIMQPTETGQPSGFFVLPGMQKPDGHAAGRKVVF